MTATPVPRIAIALTLLSLVSGCASNAVDRTTFESATNANSPLVIFESSAESGDGEAFGPGVITRDGDCIYLDTDDVGPLLLAWPSAATTWSAELNSIGFQPPATDFVAVAVGDTVVVGGTGEDGFNNEGNVPESCPDASWVSVSSITVGSSP